MKRGDIITVSASGDDGKPRPAVVVQSGRDAERKRLGIYNLESTQAERLAAAVLAEK